ncbi:MAG: hypothetical protein OER56_02925 [Hyphomicrobiales bacterium]|nr:hypothetical protein [Hyphomicrobiales bacterium]
MLAIGLAVLPATANALPDPFGDKFNNYQCYNVERYDGKIVDPSVKVRDQFGKYGQFAAKLVMVCNPVSIDGAPIAEPKVHLACYSTDPNNDGDLKPQTVLVQNRFGEQKALLKRVSTLLCVTSIKKH